MPRGGSRPNAGRKAGAITVRTRETAEKATAAGITPLEVMLSNMRFYHQAGEIALDRLLKGMATPADIINEHAPQNLDPEGTAPNAVDAFKIIVQLRKHAGDAANDAAPYVHPRMSPVEARGLRPEQQEVPLLDRLKRYATADAIKASGGKVVELKVSTRPAPTGRKKAKSK